MRNKKHHARVTGSSSTLTHPTNYHHHGVYRVQLGFQLEENGACEAATCRVTDAISKQATLSGLNPYVHMGAG